MQNSLQLQPINSDVLNPFSSSSVCATFHLFIAGEIIMEIEELDCLVVANVLSSTDQLNW